MDPMSARKESAHRNTIYRIIIPNVIDPSEHLRRPGGTSPTSCTSPLAVAVRFTRDADQMI
jgi:hypothetical protein